jgi:hypothetical protein
VILAQLGPPLIHLDSLAAQRLADEHEEELEHLEQLLRLMLCERLALVGSRGLCRRLVGSSLRLVRATERLCAHRGACVRAAEAGAWEPSSRRPRAGGADEWRLPKVAASSGFTSAAKGKVCASLGRRERALLCIPTSRDAHKATGAATPRHAAETRTPARCAR